MICFIPKHFNMFDSFFTFYTGGDLAMLKNIFIDRYFFVVWAFDPFNV